MGISLHKWQLTLIWAYLSIYSSWLQFLLLLRCLPSKVWWLHCVTVKHLLAQHIWLWLNSFLGQGLSSNCGPCSLDLSYLFPGASRKLVSHVLPTLTQTVSYGLLTTISINLSSVFATDFDLSISLLLYGSWPQFKHISQYMVNDFDLCISLHIWQQTSVCVYFV